MANFEGRHALRWLGLNHVHELNDVMHGTNGDDFFVALGGNDTIFAGNGNDQVHAGAGNDTIFAGTSGLTGKGLGAWIGGSAWGKDEVYGDEGDDAIFYGSTTSDVKLHGDSYGKEGNDTIVSGSGNDLIFGDGGHDLIYGGAGKDVIDGGTGNDTIYGGWGSDAIDGGLGDDRIWGGQHADNLIGGKGRDTFGFDAGDSGLSFVDTDVIQDFDREVDHLDLPGHGTSANFGHVVGFLDTSQDYGPGAAYNHALSFADSVLQKASDIKYEFVTDGRNGWLFVDTDGDHHVDMGIQMEHVIHLDYSNVI